jgi:hypothetical protein
MKFTPLTLLLACSVLVLVSAAPVTGKKERRRGKKEASVLASEHLVAFADDSTAPEVPEVLEVPVVPEVPSDTTAVASEPPVVDKGSPLEEILEIEGRLNLRDVLTLSCVHPHDKSRTNPRSISIFVDDIFHFFDFS